MVCLVLARLRVVFVELLMKERLAISLRKKNVVALADKIAFLIDHPDIRKEMGENGRKKFKEQFTLSIFENRMKEILLTICEGKELQVM